MNQNKRLMILDLNQVVYSAIFVSTLGKHGQQLDQDFLRHIILNILRSLNLKFRSEYDSLVIANDSSSYWRRETFPQYKHGRKKARDQSALDWSMIFSFLNQFKDDLQHFFPYKFIDVEGAEADDVIATLTKRIEYDKILIISGDKDFVQLHNEKVKQYDPIRKKYVTCDDIQEYLKQHIIKGDAGDGIPNIASPDNVFVSGRRQNKTKTSLLQTLTPENVDHPYARNYFRNRELIDFNYIPKKIQNDIIDKYNTIEPASGRLLEYFMKHKLKQLTMQINDF